MEFMDLTPQPESNAPSTDVPAIDVGEYHDVELNNFMSRPIRIAQITWSYGTNVNGSFNPWNLFFSDTRVKNRLAYYNLLKCKLCVKFVVNGNAFQYGQMFVDYLPLANFTVNSIGFTDQISPLQTSSTIYPNVQTHRQMIKLRPLDSQGACMSLPFFWPNNWLSIPLEEWQYMGGLQYSTVNPVLHANNSSATDPPIISVFAWAEDVKLSVPTAAPPATLAPQSGTEVVGKISGPASSLAGFAGSLAAAPYIGPFALATSMIASSVGAVAKLFGYSRPPIETPIQIMKPDYGGNIAQADRPECINKLTIDSSQEVTIDPSVTGVNFGDELVISSIARKETYLTQFTWDYTQAADAALWYTTVNPLKNALVPGYTSTRAIYPTAVSFASLPFRCWRGTLNFRFEVVASKFHKGRLRIMYDPKQIPVVTDFNKNYQTIMDLDSSTDLTVKVHWGVPQLVQNCGTVSLTTNAYGNSFTAPVATQDNGGLYVYVLNNLSVPSQSIAAASCLVYINVYVSAGDDFELCIPDDQNLSLLTNAAPFVPASGLEPSSGEEMSEIWEVGEADYSAGKDLVLFGEAYVSFRSLMKRYFAYLPYFLNGNSATLFQKIVTYVRRYPLSAGQDAGGGINSIANLIGTVGNYNGNNYSYSLINHLMGAFSGVRGSMRYKYQFSGLDSAGPISNIVTLTRFTQNNSKAPAITNGSAATTYTNDQLAAFFRSDTTWNGSVVLQPYKNPLLEIEDPYYEKYKFVNPKAYFYNTSLVFGGHSLTLESYNPKTTDSLYCRSYISTGEDFNLVYYTGPGYLWTSAYY